MPGAVRRDDTSERVVHDINPRDRGGDDADLGLARTDAPGAPLAVDATGATSHPRVWAAGNVVALRRDDTSERVVHDINPRDRGGDDADVARDQPRPGTARTATGSRSRGAASGCWRRRRPASTRSSSSGSDDTSERVVHDINPRDRGGDDADVARDQPRPDRVGGPASTRSSSSGSGATMSRPSPRPPNLSPTRSGRG
jgi:hypothetical protein